MVDMTEQFYIYEHVHCERLAYMHIYVYIRHTRIHTHYLGKILNVWAQTLGAGY